MPNNRPARRRQAPRGVIAAAAALALFLLPATASAGSATLSSPSDGATFYTGNPLSILAGVPYSAQRDISGCANTLFRVYRDGLPILQGVTNELSGTVATGTGTHQVYAAFLCSSPDNWIYSQTVTIHVVAGGPPGGGPPGGAPPDPAAAAKASYCAGQRTRIQKIGDIAKQVGDGEHMQKMEALSDTLTVVAEVLDPVGDKLVKSKNPVAVAYGLTARGVAKSYDTLGTVTDIAIADTKVTARQMVRDNYDPLAKQFQADCGASLPTIQIKRQSLTQAFTITKYFIGKGASVAAARKRPRRPALAKRFEANAKAFRKAFKAYSQAHLALAKHMQAPPPAEVGAVRTAAARLIKLIQEQAKLRSSLPGAIERVKARRRYFPKKLRNDPLVKAIDGLSVGRIMKQAEMSKNEQALIAYLRKQPALP